MACINQFNARHLHEKTVWNRLQEEIAEKPVKKDKSLVMEKEYLTIKISTSLIFHLSIFCRKRVFDLLNVSGSESESEHDCESKLHRVLSKL